MFFSYRLHNIWKKDNSLGGPFILFDTGTREKVPNTFFFFLPVSVPKIKLMSPFFVCFFVWVQIKNFSLIWRRHHYRWRAANFDLYSALMAIEHWAWGFFGVSHLWQGASIYNGRLRGPVTLAPVAERLAVELSPSLFTTLLSRFEHPTIRMLDKCSDRLCHHRGPMLWVYGLWAGCDLYRQKIKILKYEVSPFQFQFTLKSETFNVLIV